MTARAPHGTGDPTFDLALGGGLPDGLLLLVGEVGAGAAEFAACLMRAALTSHRGDRALLVSALRSGERARHQLSQLFEDEKLAASVECLPLSHGSFDLSASLVAWGGARVVVIETAASLGPSSPRGDVAALGVMLADFAARAHALVVVECGTGTLPPDALARLEEAADGVLRFSWRHGGTMSRRTMQLVKLRGLAPILETDEVPVFEISLRRGDGIVVSRVTNVV